MAATQSTTAAEKPSSTDKNNSAKFITGSIPQHVVEMSLTGSIGLIGIFLVDLLDMYFLSLLGQKELAAAVGYAGSITLFTTSICIGLSIATGIIQAKVLGEGDQLQAKQAFISSSFTSLVIALLILAILFPNIELFLTLLGATGLTLEYAMQYLQIVVPALPLMAMGMGFSFVLRSIGAAKSAMFVTLFASLVNGVLDPIFIFVLDLNIEGAAYASACARLAMFLSGAYILMRHHHYFCLPSKSVFINNIKLTLRLAIPAILTNFATPAGNAYIIYAVSSFGESAIAGYAIISRIIPVAFAIVYSLSGAIGPIVGQNYGAKIYQRITDTIRFSYLFMAGYVVVVWVILFLLSSALASAFGAEGETRDMVVLFCNILSLSFLFSGVTFVGNAFFNNIGKPHYSTIMNWLKATVGTIPFVYAGSYFYAANGVLIGQAVGSIAFGFVTYYVVKRFSDRLNQVE